MRIIIDTNVLISCILKPTGVLYELMAKLGEEHELFISDFSLTELTKHHKRIIAAAKISLPEYEILKAKILNQAELVHIDIIPFDIISEAYKLVKEVDENDVAFVATALFVNGYLWTGDKSLYKGLLAKAYWNVLDSNNIKTMLNYE